MEVNVIHNIDCLAGLKNLPSDSVDCCVTSPPYFNLRDYGVSGQIGLEDTPEEYIERLIAVFHEVYRVLSPDGTLWVNIGDSYAGSGKGAANYPDNAMKYKQGTNRGTVGCVSIVKKTAQNTRSERLSPLPKVIKIAVIVKLLLIEVRKILGLFVGRWGNQKVGKIKCLSVQMLANTKSVLPMSA